MSVKVMVVDDSRFVWNEIEYLLTDTEYQVVHYCKDGEEAVKSYAQVKPDIVTMDIVLPGMDGFDTARTILEQDAGARIVFVSSLAYDTTIQEAKELGSRYFLFKPFDKFGLLECLQKALA